MIVREAKSNEFSIIADFQIKMAHETERISLDAGKVEAGVQAVFDDPSKGTYYVAKDKGQVIACMLTTYEWSDWRNRTVLWIQSLYVVPAYRKQGVFKAMYENVKSMVNQSDKFGGIRLYVDKTNVNAQKVYDAIGMNGEHYQVFEWMK